MDSPTVSQKLKKQLGYCPTPLILQLSNAGEVFVETDDRVIPINVFMPGDLYGLYEALVPFTGCPVIPCWNITSGARSVFLAARVTDAIGHKRLRKNFGVAGIPPKNLKDQWGIIKTIARDGGGEALWRSEVLLFTDDWFKEKKDDINWMRFQNYLFKKSWLQSRGNRVQVEYSIMWESFARAVCSRNLKPNSYIVDTVKHLLLLSTGATSGFKPADESEVVLPTRLIERVYSEIYGLKDYAAIIMHPYVLGSGGSPSPIYYSMLYPTLLNGTPAIRKTSNFMEELREVKTLMQMLKLVLESREERMYEIMQGIDYKYFHSDKDQMGEIANSQEIIKFDPNINDALRKRFASKSFPPYGQFFRCVIGLCKT